MDHRREQGPVSLGVPQTPRGWHDKVPRFFARCGRLLQAAGGWQLAALAYKAALLWDRHPGQWHYELGILYERMRNWEDAAASYEAALKHDENLIFANDAIGRLCHRAYEEAKQAAQAIGRAKATLPLSVAFLPAPSRKNLASARIRCTIMAEALNAHFGNLVNASVVLANMPDAGVVVVSQTCSAKQLIALAKATATGSRLVYDCCDPYAEQHGKVYGIQVARRFWDLAALADAITVPTQWMRARIEGLCTEKPVLVVPDGIDYGEQIEPTLVPARKSVVWFGNPGRGNLKSGLWALAALKDRFGYDVTLITDRDKAQARPDFNVEQWAYAGFVARLRAHGLALISQQPEAAYKSENRYVVSIANGVPAISTGSESVARLLQASGFAEMDVADASGLECALAKLSDPAWRTAYVARMQQVVQERFGANAIASAFVKEVLEGALALDAGPARS